MKLLITMVFALLAFPLQKNDKLDLLCQKWRQVGMKSYGKEYRSIDKKMSESIWFKRDGTFIKELYGQLTFKGQWLLSNDSTKIAFRITQMNGTPFGEGEPFDNKFANDSIIKLTKDTLIDGQLKYFGVEKIYGHDDIYYVREN